MDGMDMPNGQMPDNDSANMFKELKKTSEPVFVTATATETVTESATATATAAVPVMVAPVQQQQYIKTAEDIQLNKQLVTEVGNKVRNAVANGAAAGNPQQIQNVQKKSYKQRRNEAKEARRAKTFTPTGDHYTIKIAEQIRADMAMHDNSLTQDYIELASANRVDLRVLDRFSQGYKKGDDGEPLNDEEAAKMRADHQFYDDYISKDVTRRAPHIRKMMKELLTANVNMAMFTDEYLGEHLGEMKLMADRMTYFENVYKDPVNKPFFDSLPKFQHDLIESRIIGLYAQVSYALLNFCSKRGVSLNYGTYEDERTAYLVKESADTTHDFVMNELQRVLERRDNADATVLRDDCVDMAKSAMKDYVPGDFVAGQAGGEEVVQTARTVFAEGIANANRVYSAWKENPESMDLATLDSTIKQRIEIRVTSTATAKENKRMAGTAFAGMKQDIALLFRGMHDQGVPMDEVGKQMEKHSIMGTAMSYVTGGAVADMSNIIMDSVVRYCLTEEGIKYFKNFVDVLGPVEYFQDKTEACIDFALQNVILTYANHNAIAGDAEYYGGDYSKVMDVAREACRTAMCASTFRRKEGDPDIVMTEELEKLRDKYKQLISDIRDRVNPEEAPQ